MKHDRRMLAHQGLNIRTESPFVRSFEALCTAFANLLRLARSPQGVEPVKGKCMADPEIPTDEEVLAALEATAGGLTPSELMAVLEVDHTRDNIIRAIQRVLDRGKVCLSDGAKLVPAHVDEPAFA